MKIHVFGASGSGTTTLGKGLTEKLSYTHLDVDEYYWEKSVPPFQTKVSFEQRQAALIHDFEQGNVIVSGSLVSWGTYWETAFDLAIFLYLPAEIRMQRLQDREVERYGDLLVADDPIRENSRAFLSWARSYDDERFTGRSLRIHREWMKLLSCPVLQLSGEMELDENIDRVIAELWNLRRENNSLILF